MNVEVQWVGGMPDELRKTVEPLVMQHLKYLPSWVRHMSVRYTNGEEDKGTVAAMVVEYPYRQVKLYVAPRFLEDTPINRKRTFAHEYFHAPMGPIRDWVRRVLDNFIGDEDVKRQLFADYHDLEEGVVQDFTFIVIPPKV